MRQITVTVSGGSSEEAQAVSQVVGQLLEKKGLTVKAYTGLQEPMDADKVNGILKNFTKTEGEAVVKA